MGSMSIWHWLIVFIIGFFTIYPCWRIVKKAGFSGWWSLLSFVPLLNVIFFWIFAFIPWPATQEGRRGI